MRRHFLPSLRVATACALFICLCGFGAAAQTVKKNPLPKVGTIKDYPATGLMVGCGNLYFYKVATKSRGENYVFLSRGDGSNAWLNLNGRDVRLKQIKSGNKKSRRLNYRYGDLRVTVIFEENKSQKADDDDHLLMRIVLRRGSSVRVVQAVGSSDC